MRNLLFAVLLTGARAFAADPHQHHHSAAPAQAPVSGASVYQLGGGWTDQDGKPVLLKNFAGKKVVVALVFLRCKSACPVLTADMKRIAMQSALDGHKNVQFILASIDPKRDSVADLKNFAATHRLGPEFSVLTSNPASVRELAGVLGVQYKQEKSGDFQHSNLITLLNEKGEVESQVEGLAADSSLLIKKLNK